MSTSPLDRLWSLEDRVVLVTGGSKGIGESTARLLAHAGATVVICSRHVEECAAVADSIVAEGGRAVPIACDLTNLAAVDALPDRIVAVTSRLDGLVNNAGTIIRKLATETSAAEWEEMFRLHLVAVARLTAAAVPHLARDRGAVVNIASTHGILGVTSRAAYATAKAGVIHLTRVLAVELAPRRIRVNAVAPGLVDTPLTRDLLADPATREQLIAPIPLGRAATGDDVAHAIHFFLSPAASHVTGQTLAVDGGRSIVG